MPEAEFQALLSPPFSPHAYLETDYASMLAWREWESDSGINNCFGMGALRGSDGGFVLGVMGAHTANAGRIYFPAGLPDPSDLDGTRVDLARNVMREVAEETGLAPEDFEAAPGASEFLLWDFAGARRRLSDAWVAGVATERQGLLGQPAGKR